jgi:hypothetical protein
VLLCPFFTGGCCSENNAISLAALHSNHAVSILVMLHPEEKGREQLQFLFLFLGSLIPACVWQTSDHKSPKRKRDSFFVKQLSSKTAKYKVSAPW